MKSALLYTLVPAVVAAAGNPKRGLCFVPDSDFPEDNQVWTRAGSDLTWYYNYGDLPSPAFADKTQEEFEFIPMMWGVDMSNLGSTKFLDNVNDLIKDGRNITRVMGFNEPDTTHEVGGSNIPPANAATAWVANFVPLQEKGIQVGLPAMTGAPSGLVWLQEFLGNCSELISTSNDQKNCTFDFLPVHWYDNFEGLASHIGERLSFWPNTSIWVTEYAYAHRDLGETTAFFNGTLSWFDDYTSLGGYSYFGAFRSAKSNVGPNAVFLNNAGQLTDMGSWYLGFGATGVNPQSGAPVVGKMPSVAAAVVGVVGALFLSAF
ncbi:glycosyl hydrolase catalytic core-domain-containing protein [Plectosphaerella cucumerina]|uniref:Glycosyl hydrolase catalytic core-domain-containing protein n=1 Tax=Plectosphaerella cucumerina TaxID=40658 RepID=A0A8K0TH57_9PEZI|nr:glycosyl hydrolase catalytic core-domain-containing protein [Plectosphaerella cucumerina]